MRIKIRGSLLERIGKLLKRRTIAEIVTLPPNELLKGRNALITGGSSGIGKAIAESFLKAGARVVISGRDEKKINEVVEELSLKYGSIEGFSFDVSSSESIQSACSIILAKYDIDILVNNAGISIPAKADVCEDEFGFESVINTNLKGTYMMCKIVSQHMIENHIQGNILNIASTSSLRPITNGYTLSKWGVRGLTLGFAKILIDYGIVVNGIAPGPTVTPMMQKTSCSDIRLPNNPAKRFALPEEIGEMAVILTSGLGRLVVGDVLFMGGGSGIITLDDIKYC